MKQRLEPKVFPSEGTSYPILSRIDLKGCRNVIF
jgi:hypothetical protein